MSGTDKASAEGTVKLNQERLNMNLHDTLIHTVTSYDRKQSTKKGYNHYALGIYFQRIEEICADVAAGADVRKAVTAGFTGRLVDTCLRALNLPITTDAEQRGVWAYQPVSQIEKG